METISKAEQGSFWLSGLVINSISLGIECFLLYCIFKNVDDYFMMLLGIEKSNLMTIALIELIGHCLSYVPCFILITKLFRCK